MMTSALMALSLGAIILEVFLILIFHDIYAKIIRYFCNNTILLVDDCDKNVVYIDYIDISLM